MRRVLISLALVLTTASFEALGSSREAPYDLPYGGNRFTGEDVAEVRKRLAPLVPIAMSRAESLMAIDLDTARVRFRLMDMPRERTNFSTWMSTHGADIQIVTLRLEPILRGSYPDDSSLLDGLTHECIHVLVRQQMPHPFYGTLPEWFQEGLPIFLVGQGENRLAGSLVGNWKNPTRVLSGFSDGISNPRITGYFIFRRMNELFGHDGVLSFVATLSSGASVSQALEALGTDRNELFAAARREAAIELDNYSARGGDDYSRCRTLYEQGPSKRRQSLRCFQELIDDYPETTVGDMALYWMAKCFYHIGRNEDARRYCEMYEGRRDWLGYRDEVHYYRIRMLVADGNRVEAADLCRRYMKYFPDGSQYEKVENIAAKLN